MKRYVRNNIVIGVALTTVLVSYQNCGKVQNSMQFASSAGVNSNGDPVSTDPVDPNTPPEVVTNPPNNPPPDDTVVCGGLGEDDGDEVLFGIKGNIFTSTKSSDPKSAVKYATDATPVRNSNGDLVSIYLNNINVPERRFNQGFYNLNGDALKDNNDNVLIEYFGLKLEYTLRLPKDYEAGYYHIAVEADDGSVLKILGSDNSYKTVIDNDGQHSTQTKCTSKAIYLDHTTQIPSELYYYQGPREHIALRLAWKKVSSEESSASCGSIGVADGSASSNNWNIIPSSAYQQPGVVKETNPCLDSKP